MVDSVSGDDGGSVMSPTTLVSSRPCSPVPTERASGSGGSEGPCLRSGRGGYGKTSKKVKSVRETCPEVVEELGTTGQWSHGWSGVRTESGSGVPSLSLCTSWSGSLL